MALEKHRHIIMECVSCGLSDKLGIKQCERQDDNSVCFAGRMAELG
jgi:hypothetical protein